MVELALIATIGVFAAGIVVGIILVVSHGIHTEERRHQQIRRYQEQTGIWDGPDAPSHFFTEQAADRVGLAARRFNGLYVRHVPDLNRTDTDALSVGV